MLRSQTPAPRIRHRLSPISGLAFRYLQSVGDHHSNSFRGSITQPTLSFLPASRPTSRWTRAGFATDWLTGLGRTGISPAEKYRHVSEVHTSSSPCLELCSAHASYSSARARQGADSRDQGRCSCLPPATGLGVRAREADHRPTFAQPLRPSRVSRRKRHHRLMKATETPGAHKCPSTSHCCGSAGHAANTPSH